MALLNDNEIRERVGALEGWSVVEKSIVKEFTLGDFIEAIGFVNKVAILAEKADHHPDILIEYKRVTLTLSTHSEGGLTNKDFRLAGEIDDLV